MTYETIADKFKENNLINNFGEYYYLGKVAERNSLNKIFPKIGSYIYWISCGYGQRSVYPVVTSLAVIIICAILYLFVGMKVGETEIVTFSTLLNSDFKAIMGYINESLSLSVGMFAGVGTINSQPMPILYMVSNIEMMIGLLMMGVGIATLVRKAKNN